MQGKEGECIKKSDPKTFINHFLTIFGSLDNILFEKQTINYL